MAYQRKTDNPKAGRPKGEPKQTVTLRLPTSTVQKMAELGPVNKVAIRVISDNLPASKFRTL